MLTSRALLLLCVAAVYPLPASEKYAPLGSYTAAERRHWAFQKRKNPEVPVFSDAAGKAWVKTPIDAFVLEKLRKEGLEPAPPATRRILIRRVYFDLIGIPPTPREVENFVSDKLPGAWERVVDRLLANPHYGERWGQRWLDVVRYAETDGFEYDTHRNGAWRYRDYVIRSFNEDKPYDRFVKEQLAGDELRPGDQELQIAAGFQRLGPLRKNAGNQEVASSRNEVLTEMTNAVGAALLGVTLGCARCHDHKFDPIRQADYYRIQAYFAATHEKDVSLASEAEQAEWKKKSGAFQEQLKKLRQSMKGLEGSAKEEIERQLKDMEARAPEPLPAIFSVSNDPARITPVHLLSRGDHLRPGARVGMRPLGVLLEDGTPEYTAVPENPRIRLAEWITSPENPLTARVMVNRIWQGHFGRGIAAMPNDFGRMGGVPSHRELLDWLANQFVDGGWRIKPLHRTILLSSAYQQSSHSPIGKAAREKDPDNKLLWKYSRRRLEAEEIRDAMLAVSGRLNLKQGGPGVMPPVDQELIDLLYKPSQWAVAPDAEEHHRRSIYLIAKRNLRLPFMEVFDAPDLQISCPRRESSTHPPQALELLNGRTANEMAEALAARLRKEAGISRTRQVELAYRFALGRSPSKQESQLAVSFLRGAPLREFALAVLNLNEFLYVE